MDNSLRNNLLHDYTHDLYHCFVTVDNVFVYEKIPDNQVFMMDHSVMHDEYPGRKICLHKRIPACMRRPILYYYFLPRFL